MACLLVRTTELNDVALIRKAVKERKILRFTSIDIRKTTEKIKHPFLIFGKQTKETLNKHG